jgi:TPR repeat protein
MLGCCYEYGCGSLKSVISSAVYWYHKAAKQLNYLAQYKLGILVLRERRRQADAKIEAAAVRLFESAAGTPNNYWRALFALGCCHRFGIGVPKNDGIAARHIYAASVQGLAEAQYLLGYSFETGAGVRLNLGNAAKLYEVAAEAGLAVAQFALAQYYELSQGDMIKALKWYELAAVGGHDGACYRLNALWPT